MKYSPVNPPIDPVDYLAIGHISQDITAEGLKIGGTVSFAGLTALAFGLRVGVVTAIPETMDVSALGDLHLHVISTEKASTFENIQKPQGRVQVLHHQARPIQMDDIPEVWRNTPIVHLGPICQELEPALVKDFPQSFIGVTPQGWMRTWDEEGRVIYGSWRERDLILEKSTAVVLSIEDVHHDESRIEDLIPQSRILVVTEGAAGVRVYWNGDVRHFNAPEVEFVDSTGAGDIFAAVFFIRLHQTKDPWEAAHIATKIASASITRKRLDGIPTPDEIQSTLTEIIAD